MVTYWFSYIVLKYKEKVEVIFGHSSTLRDLVLSCLRHNIMFRARHNPGLINSRADYLSRSQVAKVKELSPDAEQLPTPVPENLILRSWVIIQKVC